jgi:hypothetical protein
MKPSEVWIAELGMAEEIRPVLLFLVPRPADARSLVISAPLTSTIRGTGGELDIGTPPRLPKCSAENVQGLTSFDHNEIMRILGALFTEHHADVKAAFLDILDMQDDSM